MVQDISPTALNGRNRSRGHGTKGDWKKKIKRLRFDRDIVERFGLKAARFITYLECWLSGKVKRGPDSIQYTYDPAWEICDLTGLKPATLERIVKQLRKDRFIRVKPGRKNTRWYALSDAKGYFKSRAKEKHVFALREDADKHGEPVAILLYNLRYWARYNKDRIRLFQGRYWRYDRLKELVWRYTGFLTKEQLRDALDYMYEKQLVDMIAFCDGNGVNHDDKFWITLLELPPVDDYEPQNRVRPASLFTPEGTRIDAGVDAEHQRLLDDKTASPNDKTPWPNDRTAAGGNGHQLTHSAGVTGNGSSPLIEDSLSVAAGGRWRSLRLNASTRKRKPPAVGPIRTAFGLSEAFGFLGGVSDRRGWWFFYEPSVRATGSSRFEKLTRQYHHLNLSIHLNRTRSINKEGWLEPQEEILLRIPRSDRRNFLHQLNNDYQSAGKEAEDTGFAQRFGLNEELRQFSYKKSPRECFSHRYGDPRQPCKNCAWAKSCKIATPVEIQEAIRHVSILNTPDWDVLRESDRPENVADTYRAAYREVFGKDAPDMVGKAVTIYRNAQSLRLPVRYYCLVYMLLWANTHPMQTFYCKYLSAEHAFEGVKMVLDLCNQKFGDRPRRPAGDVAEIEICRRPAALAAPAYPDGALHGGMVENL